MKNVIYVEETDSTNSLAKREREKPDKTVFIAKRQTNGRGRNGRVWNSDDENSLYMSILLKPQISFERVSLLTLVFGLSAFKALKKYAEVGIKWPNDIILNSKKLSGILCESVINNEKLECVVLGIGVNINNTDFPDEIKKIATSLKLETGEAFKISQIAEEIIYEFEILYEEFLKNGLCNILKSYKDNCITLGKEAVVIKNNKQIKAYALDITDDGGLLIKTDDGEEVVYSGEVSIKYE